MMCCMCVRGGSSLGGGELSRVFADRRQQSELCQREAAEECRRFTELALQQQRATIEQQQQRRNSANDRLAGAPC